MQVLMSKKNDKTTNINNVKGINIISKLGKDFQHNMAASVAQML